MGLWGILLFTVVLFAGISRTYKGDTRDLMKPIFIALTIGLAFFAGMRSGIGDTGYYMYNFLTYKDCNFTEVLSEKEFGFKLLIVLLGKITGNPQFFLLVCSFITIILIFRTIKKYSEDVVLSVFLFISSGLYLSTMNGLRQYLVVAVFFAAISLILEKKLLSFIILCLLLSTVHTSALVMIPVYVFAQTKAWSQRKIVLLLLVFFCILFFSGSLMEFLSNMIADSEYGRYSASLLSSETQTAHPLRVIIMCVPAILSFLERKSFSLEDKYYRVYTNMAILTAILYGFSLRNWVFARLALYTVPYLLLFYPMLLKKLPKKSDKRVFYLAFYILFIIFFLFEVRNTPYMSYYLRINTDLIGTLTRGFYP